MAPIDGFIALAALAWRAYNWPKTLKDDQSLVTQVRKIMRDVMTREGEFDPQIDEDEVREWLNDFCAERDVKVGSIKYTYSTDPRHPWGRLKFNISHGIILNNQPIDLEFLRACLKIQER